MVERKEVQVENNEEKKEELENIREKS